MPLDVQIKVEPCEEDMEQMCYNQTDTFIASDSCKDFNKCEKNSTKIGTELDLTTAKEAYNVAEFVEASYDEGELILPDIASESETGDTNNGLNIESSVSTSLDTIQIKVEPSEGKSDDGDKSVCSCQINNSSIPSKNVKQRPYQKNVHLTTYEILFEVIKYLDDRRNEDKFQAAEKYYTFKLRSASKIQQRCAKSLIIQVLEEAKKGNLNSQAGLFHYPGVNQELKELDCFYEEKNRETDTNLGLLKLSYLCPLKNKVLNKIKKSLLNCKKQNPSIISCASQLRSLTTVQYSFADKLINEILSEAVLKNLKRTTKIHLHMKDSSEKPNNFSCNTFLQSTEPLVANNQTIFIHTPTQILGQNSLILFTTDQNSSSSSQKESFLLTTQALEQNSNNTAQGSPLTIKKENFDTTSIQMLNSNNIVQDSSLQIKKEYLDPTPTQTLELNSQMNLNITQYSSLPIKKESFDSTYT